MAAIVFCIHHYAIIVVDLHDGSMASIAYENILRFSRDCLWSTLTGHFQSREIGGNAQLTACCSSFSSGSVCKTIALDGERKGVRGGGCGRPASGSLSFSITKSVATKHPVDVTSPHIAHSCRPMLQLHYRRRSDGWTSWCVAGVVGCVWGQRDGQMRMRAGWCISLQSPLISLPPHHPQRGATHGGRSTDGRAAGCSAALAGRRHLTAHKDNAAAVAAVLRTIPCCN